jgi:hypothetical protein
MPFGFVTKRQLDQLREDLTKDVRAGQAFQEELQYEWAKWFNKFRSLYAMLLKREKSGEGAGVEPTGTDDEAPSSAGPPARLFRSRRGF